MINNIKSQKQYKNNEFNNDIKQNNKKIQNNNQKRYFGKDLKNTNNNVIEYFEKNKINAEKENKKYNIIQEEKKKIKDAKSDKLNKSNILLGKEKNEDLLIEEIEYKHRNNPQYLTEYSNQILTHLKETENINIPNYKKLFNNQIEINNVHRMGVIHWIISVSERFELLPETLYLAINIFDRYLEKKTLLRKNLQLIASTCLFIASKYEEIYAPEIRDFIYISKELFSRDDIINIEYDILKILNFNLLTVSPYIFLVRFFFISGNDNIKIFYLASYILDICLTDISFCYQSSSLKASVVLFISRKIILENNKTIWNNSLKIHTGYSEKDLKESIKECAKYIYNYTNNKYSKNYKKLPSYIKYSSEKYEEISIFFDGFLNETINSYKKGKKKLFNEKRN